MLNNLVHKWADEPAFLQLVEEINSKKRISVNGVDGTARNYLMAALSHYTGRQTLIVAAEPAGAEKVYSDIDSLYPGKAFYLPARELFVSSEYYSRSEEQQHVRLKFLSKTVNREAAVWVTSASALTTRVMPVDNWQEECLTLESGMELDREKLVERLVRTGYERESLTEIRGKFSARGDIVDIYPPDLDYPVRVEFFGDIIESLRFYDPFDQRSKGSMQKVLIIPARELMVTEKSFNDGKEKILKELNETLGRLIKRGEKTAAKKLKDTIESHVHRLSQPDGLDILSSYYPFFYGEGARLTDYLTDDCLIMIEEPEAIIEKADELSREYNDFLSSLAVGGELLLSKTEPLWGAEELLNGTGCPEVSFSFFPEGRQVFGAAGTLTFEAKSVPFYHGQQELFLNDLQTWNKEYYTVYLLSATEERGRGLLQLIGDPDHSAAKQPVLLEGSLEEGFIIPSLKIALVTERNLVPKRVKKRRIRHKDGIRLSDYRELSVGDYVVHEQHGIGRYEGVNTLEVKGNKRDYIVVKYRGTDKLYIPVEQVELIQKYSSGDKPAPRLHSLGGGEWQRLKSRVSKSVEKMAQELLSLYAARQAVEGYSYGQDHPWQAEFEAQFSFEETPDQLKAIADVKDDLRGSIPMDRLLCGDVGYGKTEVAMRAAFKVAMEGRQTAVLVPTTILAQQHYRTFRERFASFPVRVAQLSRFVSPSMQKKIVADLAAGKIDIVIGTHRLLSGDVEYNDLGLLVIDEEHRFGVQQKEKIRKVKLEVDTLAMTATPIPRSLHFSLSGGRDISIIDTPPEDRYPIQTYVLEYSETLIREAVQRELNRKGQVFIVYNRVDSIDRFAEKIRSLFPSAALAVGHGQMPERALEKIMAGFQEGLYQILVSTTIIESGLDIPNVNTLIVCDADRFGLAQLYQIRGRVGRSSRIAYAYLTYRKEKAISETAKKRLKAVKELTELGSGFKLALRDLEIRGAGNILGAEQHGFIAAVGYDMYTKLLEQAVAKLKNEKIPARINTRLELNLDAYLPASYITAGDQKVEMYQRIFTAETEADLDDIREELEDRYGLPPEPVKRLLKAAGLRRRAVHNGIDYIGLQNRNVIIQFHRTCKSAGIKIISDPGFANYDLQLVSQKPLTLKLKNAAGMPDLIDFLDVFLGLLEEKEKMEPLS